MKKLLLLSFIFVALVLFSGSFLASVQSEEKGPVQELIESLEVGKPVSYRSLTVIPVYSVKIKDETAYVTFQDALKNKWIEISEVQGGRVPQVKITNMSKHEIFIMGGEILTGCKQDRILAQDVLLSPWRKNLLAPVYCVEHGRWSHKSPAFYTKGNIGTYKLRKKAQKRAPAAQSEIWEEIAVANEEMGVKSGTSAYQDAYDKKENQEVIASVERKMSNIPHLYDDTIGVVIGLGEEIISADVFANPYLFKKQWPKILRSSALSSVSCRRQEAITQKDAVDFLKGLRDKTYKTKDALDLGYELSVNDSMVNVNALVYKVAIIHLAGFPQEENRIGMRKRDGQEQRRRVIRQNLQEEPLDSIQ